MFTDLALVIISVSVCEYTVDCFSTTAAYQAIQVQKSVWPISLSRSLIFPCVQLCDVYVILTKPTKPQGLQQIQSNAMALPCWSSCMKPLSHTNSWLT